MNASAVAKRAKSPVSQTSPTAVSVSMPRMQRSRPPGVALIGLDAIPGPGGHQPRRNDHAIDPSRGQVALQPEPGRPGLHAHTRRRPRPQLTLDALVVIGQRDLSEHLTPA